jgi:hypothetical protein
VLTDRLRDEVEDLFLSVREIVSHLSLSSPDR